jgi:hypothetical protein
MTNQEYFEKTRDEILSRVELADEIVRLNSGLTGFNWMFIHPQIFTGKLNRLTKLAANPNCTQDHITKVFADLFYDFRVTALFIDGFLKTNTYVAPFNSLVDQAVMLAIGHDYAGAVHLLIPVIEGSIRNYLINVKGKQNHQIMRSQHLLQVFGFLEHDYVANKEPVFMAKLDAGVIDLNKFKRLVALERQYIHTWFSMIKKYLEDNLYMDTSQGQVQDLLNRHVLVHGFSSQVDYTLSNFLKIFNALLYVSWAFRISDQAMPQVIKLENEDILYKWAAFEKIKVLTEITNDIKISVYNKYPDFKAENFHFQPTISRLAPLDSAEPIDQQLAKVDQMLEQMFPQRGNP